MELKPISEIDNLWLGGSFNRTTMELKLGTCQCLFCLGQSFNRTTMELKQDCSTSARSLRLPFNRTTMELKPLAF